MDFYHPVSSLIPGATGKILELLGRTSAELNLSSVAELSGVSGAQTSRVLSRLVDLGIVSRRDVPPTALFSLNREHLAADAIETLVRLPRSVVGRLRDLATSIRPPPVSVTLFGSAAHGRATVDSDIDVLMVRPEGVEDDDLEWTDTTIDWTLDGQALTGNLVNVIEVAEGEVPELLGSDSSLWRTIASEGITLFGVPLHDLASAR